jgi:hypothetical protein
MKKRDQTKGERVGSRVRDGHEGHRERAASAGRRAFLLRSAEQCVCLVSAPGGLRSSMLNKSACSVSLGALSLRHMRCRATPCPG